MKIKYSNDKVEKELSQLINSGKIIKDINKIGEKNYKELNHSLKHWKKTIKDSFKIIFKDSSDMIEEIFPSSGAIEMIGGRNWEYKFDHYIEEVNEILYSLESIKKRIKYAKKEKFIDKYFKDSNSAKETFLRILYSFLTFLLFVLIFLFLRCSIISKEINTCTIDSINNLGKLIDLNKY